jgi:hypothetical protein
VRVAVASGPAQHDPVPVSFSPPAGDAYAITTAHDTSPFPTLLTCVEVQANVGSISVRID